MAADPTLLTAWTGPGRYDPRHAASTVVRQPAAWARSSAESSNLKAPVTAQHAGALAVLLVAWMVIQAAVLAS